MEWLEKGRNIIKPGSEISTPWTYTLPNGVRVEFIGVCEHPSAGKQWWGPDGKPIEAVPYINSKDHFTHITEGRIARSFAYRFEMPGNGGRSSTRMTVEGNSGSTSYMLEDRYGVQIHSIRGQAYLFDKDREKTDMTVYYSLNNEPMYGCTLKNISLIMGKETDFKFEDAGIYEEEN